MAAATVASGRTKRPAPFGLSSVEFELASEMVA